MARLKNLKARIEKFFKCANPGLFAYFCSFHIPIQMTHIQFKLYKLKKAWIVCLGLEPKVAGQKVQTNPLSYGGTPMNREVTSIH